MAATHVPVISISGVLRREALFVSGIDLWAEPPDMRKADEGCRFLELFLLDSRSKRQKTIQEFENASRSHK